MTKPVAVNVPGNTVVQDNAGDFLLVNIDPGDTDKPCSLPIGVPLTSPPWTDIKTAKITQLGNGDVELTISLYARVPEAPSFFVSYIWQFESRCLFPTPGKVYKDCVVVWWDPDVGHWQGNWRVITSCDPRTIEPGDPVEFRFTKDGVRARVKQDDLMLATSGDKIIWHAAVRRLPFVFAGYPNTIPVDVAPDVLALNSEPPPFMLHPEDPATWVPRP